MHVRTNPVGTTTVGVGTVATRDNNHISWATRGSGKALMGRARSTTLWHLIFCESREIVDRVLRWFLLENLHWMLRHVNKRAISERDFLETIRRISVWRRALFWSRRIHRTRERSDQSWISSGEECYFRAISASNVLLKNSEKSNRSLFLLIMDAPPLPFDIQFGWPPLGLGSEFIMNDSSNKFPASILRTLPFESVYDMNARFDIDPKAWTYVHENSIETAAKLLSLPAQVPEQE